MVKNTVSVAFFVNQEKRFVTDVKEKTRFTLKVRSSRSKRKVTLSSHTGSFF